MNILYIVHNFPPKHWAGTEVYTYNIAKESMKRGHTANVYCWEYLVDEPDFSTVDEEFEGIDIHRIMRDRTSFSHMEFTNKQVEKDFKSFIKNKRYDMAHITHLFGLSVKLIDIMREKNIPVVLTIPDYWFICPTAHFLMDIKEIEDLTEEDFSICGKLEPEKCAACLTPRREEYIKARTEAIL